MSVIYCRLIKLILYFNPYSIHISPFIPIHVKPEFPSSAGLCASVLAEQCG